MILTLESGVVDGEIETWHVAPVPPAWLAIVQLAGSPLPPVARVVLEMAIVVDPEAPSDRLDTELVLRERAGGALLVENTAVAVVAPMVRLTVEGWLSDKFVGITSTDTDPPVAVSEAGLETKVPVEPVVETLHVMLLVAEQVTGSGAEAEAV